MNKAILLVVIVLGISASATDREAQDCAYKVAYRTDPYACANARTYVHCMACLDDRLNWCKKQMMNKCGLDEATAKDECSLGKYLSPRICGKEL